jgi:hypothetical protein
MHLACQRGGGPNLLRVAAIRRSYGLPMNQESWKKFGMRAKRATGGPVGRGYEALCSLVFG